MKAHSGLPDVSLRAAPGGRVRALRMLAAGVLAVPLFTLAGCSIEPWVKPYERERLADPIMKPSRDLLAEKHHEHIYDVREGARGATGVQGGGCGCN
jgi:hypothetical protein